MQSHDYARLLLRKAGQDEFTVEKLIPDSSSPDEVIGFHAQQAVEKMLKAVLAWHSVRYRRTHDLVELLDLIEKNGIAIPPALQIVRRLNPFASEYRYEDLPSTPEPPLNRTFARECIQKTKSWVESIVLT